MSKNNPLAPDFFKALLKARSPSGFEQEAQKVLDKYLKPFADHYEKDTLGNRIATLNPKGDPVVMLAGHMDELGLIVKYIDDKGFIYFDTIGGHDLTLVSGRRVSILTEKGPVSGITGKRAIHLMDPEERKKALKIHEMWIDIGAESKKEALKSVSIGDPVVYDHDFQILRKNRATARAFDNKSGCYVIAETFRRIAKMKKQLQARLVSVATTQEEIGVRGVFPSTFAVDPHIAIAVDVGHATDHPDCNLKRFGEFQLGKGPILSRGPNINPIVFNKLVASAKKLKIPYQVEAEARPTSTDARMIQISRKGVATGLVSIPLRYMHTPSEMIDLMDIENTVKLIASFVQSLKKKEYAFW